MKNFIYKSDHYQIEFEINDWAERSKLSLLTKSKDTVIFTVINLGEEIFDSDFLPLTVDYEEKFYAGGKIFGSRFLRREGRPTITSILNARLIDRSIRPTFPFFFRKQIQIVNTILSYDPEIDPTFLSLLGTSFGIQYLKLPWKGPIAGIGLNLVNNKWQFNFSNNEKEFNDELFVAGNKEKINMIELEAKEISNEKIIEGCHLALAEIKKLISFIESCSGCSGNSEVLNLDLYERSEKKLNEFLEVKNINLESFLFNNKEGDQKIENLFLLLEEEDFGDLRPYIVNSLNQKLKKIFKEGILKNKVRPDGRKNDEIRKLESKIDVLPRVHGSALFKRGLTHVLSTVTLGGPGEELILKEIEYEGVKRFIHHYNFPPYSTGELGSNKGPSRREIGHGELAEKALRNFIPPQEEFPYTLRVVSEVLSSNGSTSMASVCASSLALMAAGVPFKKHIAGVSIGIAYENDENYELLTDIQGPEDFFGGMDFKVAGTEDGVTAIQLDVKIDGLNIEQIKESLKAAEKARLSIVNHLKEVIKKPRESVSSYVPKIEVMKIDPLKIGLVVGTGGKTINEIINETNVKIDIQPEGTVYIIGEDKEKVERAKVWIKIITDSLKVGDFVKGKVVKILPFGAILELTPQKTALLHISEIADKKIENINDEFKVGDDLNVVVKQVNDEGKIYLSLKDAKRRKR